MVGKKFPAFPSHLKWRRSPQERREELQGRATIPRVPQMSQSIPGKPVFPALPRHSSRGSTDTTVARGRAMWESLVGKPRGKATGTRSGGLRKGQSPCELLGGLSGFLSLRRRGLRPCVESVPEPEDSSPVLTCILRYFWSLPRGVSPRLEWGHARSLSSRAVAELSRFPSREARDLWLSLEAFPGGFSTRLSHRAVPRATVV